MDGRLNRAFSVAVLISVLLMLAVLPGPGYTQSLRGVVVSEIAWMGTTTSYNGEWIELYNSAGGGVLIVWSKVTKRTRRVALTHG